MAEKGNETNYLITFISTAPVAATIWLTITAGILIEFNRFFPDLLFHPPYRLKIQVRKANLLGFCL